MQRATGNSEREVRLCEDLDLGLHAMAQPLTVLRGVLGALLMRSSQSGDTVRYLEMSNKQVDRLCELLLGMQNLLNVVQFEAASAPIDVWGLIAPVLEDHSSLFKEAGVKVAAARPDRAFGAIGDPARTVQAIQAALATAVALSSHGDVIHLDFVPGDGFLDVTLRNNNTHTKNLTSIDRLNLSLAAEGIRSQRGLYEFIENPLRVSLKLPLSERNETSNENASGCAVEQQIHPSIC
jgi:hypothetical protein